MNIDTTTCRFLFREHSLKALYPYIRRVDLSPTRSDVKVSGVSTHNDLEPGSEFFEMVKELIELGFNGPFNLKVPLSAAEQLTGMYKSAMRPGDIGNVYLNLASIILENIRR